MKKEKHAAANAIWMLCYDDKIKKFVRDQQDTYKVIVKLAETSVHDEIRVSCKGILMLLNDGAYQILLIFILLFILCSK